MTTQGPRKVNVSVAVDKQTHQSSVALRDLGDPTHAHLLTTTEARHIAAMLIHAAKTVDGINVLAAEMAQEGLSDSAIQDHLNAVYPDLLSMYRRPDR